MAKKKNNEEKPDAVAKTPGNAVGQAYDYGDDAGVGQDFTLDDLLIPFVGLIQKDSAAVIEEDPKFVPNAKPGDILNTATKDIYPGKDGLVIVPALVRRTYVEWLPDRGGFVAEHDPASPVVKGAEGHPRTGLFNGDNILTETRSVYAIVCDDETRPIGFVVIPFTSTKISPLKAYLTKLNAYRTTVPANQMPPLFANAARITTTQQSNRKGRFFNFVVEPANGSVKNSMLAPDHPAFAAAKELRAAIEAGAARADYQTAEADGPSNNTASEDAAANEHI